LFALALPLPSFSVVNCRRIVHDFAAIGLLDNISGQALLASLHKVPGPFVIQALGNAFLAAQLRNTVFNAQAIQHNLYFFLRTVRLECLALDFTNSLF